MEMRLRFHDTPHAIFDAPARATRFSRMTSGELDIFIARGIAVCSAAARDEETAGDVGPAEYYAREAAKLHALNERNAEFWGQSGKGKPK